MCNFVKFFGLLSAGWRAAILRFFMLAALVGMAGCSWVIPKLYPFYPLPAPQGPYAIGTEVFEWTDQSRLEWFTDDPQDHRRIVVQVWYPTDAADAASAAVTYPYLDQPARRIRPLARQMALPAFLIQHMQTLQSHANYGAAPRMSAQSRPVILFSHGLGGWRAQNTVQVEELVSHGYVVVAVDHTYDAYVTLFADGTDAEHRSSPAINGEAEFWAVRGPQLATRAADLSFVLDRIEALQAAGAAEIWRQMAIQTVGVFGHSYGGATAVMVLHNDPRVVAGIALDGWMVPVPETVIETGFDKPFIYMGQPQWDDALNYEKLDRMLAKSEAATEKALLAGTKHFDFSDTPQVSSAARRFGFTGTVPPPELKTQINSTLLDFFNRHLVFNNRQAVTQLDQTDTR
ncbi:MAG TPA: hypothetical protein DER02_08660 [Gammaproteobacteria bacterium]|nr:hypothetical protein [Gammaproteobacteria bacterium]